MSCFMLFFAPILELTNILASTYRSRWKSHLSDFFSDPIGQPACFQLMPHLQPILAKDLDFSFNWLGLAANLLLDMWTIFHMQVNLVPIIGSFSFCPLVFVSFYHHVIPGAISCRTDTRPLLDDDWSMSALSACSLTCFPRVPYCPIWSTVDNAHYKSTRVARPLTQSPKPSNQSFHVSLNAEPTRPPSPQACERTPLFPLFLFL